MRSIFAAVTILTVTAMPAAATPPQPLITMQLGWQAPGTLTMTVHSALPFEPRGRLVVTTGESGETKVCDEEITVIRGVTERSVSVPLRTGIQRIGVRIMSEDEGLLLVETLHVARDSSGETRVVPPAEIDAIATERRAQLHARARREELERMRNHVQRVLARGGRPTCSAESAAVWNQAVVAELGDKAPAACRERVQAAPPEE